jgi:hypothetical protein
MDTGLVDWRCVLPLIIDGLLCVKCVQFYHRSAKVFCGPNANGDSDDEDSSELVSGLFNVKSSTVTSNSGSVGLPTVARQLIPY